MHKSREKIKAFKENAFLTVYENHRTETCIKPPYNLGDYTKFFANKALFDFKVLF